MCCSPNRMGVPLALCLLLGCTGARAGFDTPGEAFFAFLAEEHLPIRSFDQVPDGAPLLHTGTEAYFSTDASSFAPGGVFVWAGFDLRGPDGWRRATLLLDLDPGGWWASPDIPLDPGRVRASYLETRDGVILFEGVVAAGDVWIIDMFDGDGDDGALEARFELIFTPAGGGAGARVLERGRLVTSTSVRDVRASYGAGGRSEITSADQIETGCSSRVAVEDQEPAGCAGDSYDDASTSGCEGDSYDDSSAGCGGEGDYDEQGSGCEGDTYDSDTSSCEGDGFDSSGSSCEGDGYGGSSSSSDISCEGDGYDSDAGACADTADAATGAPRLHRRGRPLRILMRLFPELVGFVFILQLKRRYRNG